MGEIFNRIIIKEKSYSTRTNEHEHWIENLLCKYQQIENTTQIRVIAISKSEVFLCFVYINFTNQMNNIKGEAFDDCTPSVLSNFIFEDLKRMNNIISMVKHADFHVVRLHKRQFSSSASEWSAFYGVSFCVCKLSFENGNVDKYKPKKREISNVKTFQQITPRTIARCLGYQME